MPARVLVVEDDEDMRPALVAILRRAGYRVLEAGSAAAARVALLGERPDLAIIDINLPDASGVEVLRFAREESPDTDSVVLTGQDSVSLAVETMKIGAVDFLVKPVERSVLLMALERALDHRRLRQEVHNLRVALTVNESFEGVVGNSAEIRKLAELVTQVAPSNASVLIEGETGTGKEMFARAIHAASRRSKGPLLAVNCAALPDTLIEAELFGHEKGAFTGAERRRAGRFELANGGTLFLDEVSEIPLPTQVKLLRVLQEGAFERVGGSTPVRSDFRLIAATNKPLAQEVEAGRFREDLYYRMNVIELSVPPLRERSGDVALLAQHFLSHYAGLNRKSVAGFTDEALRALEAYPYPGNVRELENIIERAAVLAPGEKVRLTDLPRKFQELAGAVAPPRTSDDGIWIPFTMSMAEMEREVLLAYLERENGNKRAVARRLGIGARTVYRKLAEYGPESPHRARGPAGV